MQVSVENTSALERRMSITVPAERIESQVNKRLQQTAQKAKIAGFRPGKVPMSEIKRRFGADARNEAVGDVIQASFYEAVVEQKLNPAGSPSIEPKSLEAGKDLEYVAVFEVFPEFTVAGFESINVERLSAEVADADLDNMLEVLRKQNTRFEAVERAAQNDDQVNILSSVLAKQHVHYFGQRLPGVGWRGMDLLSQWDAGKIRCRVLVHGRA